MKATTTQIAKQIRNLYYTMPRNHAKATINGHLVDVSTGKSITDHILIMVETEDGKHTWFKASKNASGINSLYNISEKAAQLIA